MKSRCDDLACHHPLELVSRVPKALAGLARVTVVCGAALWGLPALANLVSPVTVSLIAPGGLTPDFVNIDSTPISVTQTMDSSLPILAGDGAIGAGYMLPGEQIAMSGDSILIHVGEGAELNGIGYTGYLGHPTGHARYELSGLSITGRTLTGIDVFAFDNYLNSGFTGVSAGVGVSLIDTDANGSLDTLIFNLDDLVFVDRQLGGSLNFAEFRIDILSTPDTQPPPVDVPEPGSLALVAAGLLAFRLVSSRRTLSRAVEAGE